MKKIFYILFGCLIAQNAPISDAGLDRYVQVGEVVTLDGSNSYDPDGGDITEFQWSAPSNITLSDSQVLNPTFNAPNSLDTLTFNLTVTDSEGTTSVPFPATDLFISEYSEGSSPHQYIEIYNGTSESIDLTNYEIWLVRGAGSSPMSWSAPDRILLFNSSTSQSDVDLEEIDNWTATVSPLEPGQTLMLLREAEDEEFDYIGQNFAVFPGLSQLGGDDAIALKKDGVIIDQVGEDTDPGSAWDVAGESNATRNHTLVRKSTVVSGNTDWGLSAGTNASDSEWIVYDQDTFDFVFEHYCTSCDDEVILYVTSPPIANPAIITDGLLIGQSDDICDHSVTLDASSSTTVTGNINYQWIDENGLISNDDLTKKQPTFSTIGIPSGQYEFGLIVYDGILYSEEETVTVNIADNLCPIASLDVVYDIDNQWVEQYPAMVLFDSENFTDVGNGQWDDGETFYDIGDFQYTSGEDYIDVNGNEQWDETEPFVDMGDGQYNLGEQFDDIGDGIYSEGEDFVDMNGNNQWDDSQIVYLSALNSVDPDDENLTYTLIEISNLLDAEPQVIENGVISFIRPDFGELGYGEVVFTLSVSDGSETSLPDTLAIRFGRPSPPDIPIFSPRVEHERVILSWNSSAEESEDYLTGYYDFEGYKLYKSTDGGETWGGEEDKIYDDTGAFVGWKPYRQWDLSETEDLTHCNYSSGYCNEGSRNINVAGYDPYSYWLNIGTNSGLTYSFIDYDVVDGVEYTYALTSYDTGIWTTYEEYDTGEIVWYDSNPNHFMDVDGRGFPTMESENLIDGITNYVTLSPGYYASNIYFPSVSEQDEVFTADSSNYGNALVEYELVDLDNLQPRRLMFEIQADQGSNNAYEGLKTFNPALYAYYLSEDNSPLETMEIPYAGLLNSEIDSLLDLPGSFLDNQDNMIVIPDYKVENMEIKYVDDLGWTQNWTDFIDGTRMLFTNPWREYGLSINVLNISDPEYWIYYEGEGSDYYAPIINESYYPENKKRKEEFSRNIDYSLKFNYSSETTTFDNRPPYRYQVEFSKTAMHEAYEIQQNSSPASQCEGFDNNTFLPFRVKNLTTGKYVGLRHIDRGYNKPDGGDDTFPSFFPAAGCEQEGIDNYVGDCDCVWTMYEDVVFVEDTVTTRYNPNPHSEFTYSLEISYDFFERRNFLENLDLWNQDYPYDLGVEVRHEGNRWRATDDATPGTEPGTIYDPEGDGVDNNPWMVVYPWSDFTGDSITLVIEPWTWFADGDKWIADLSKLGEEENISQDMLSQVSVSPNPYFRHSEYNESMGEHKIRFSQLPTKCEINIFTISGERVRTINFEDDGYYGNYFWDQKTGNGDLVAPGLYIYTIEANENKYVSKFAIVR
tara:strand:+ start:67 stop:4152 length:4086 start_codon:yes stop_codon:yes gene_type:complete